MEALIPGLLVAFGTVYFVTTTGLPIESTVFPRFLMIVMFVLAILIGATAIIQGEGSKPLTMDATRRPALVLLCSVGFLVLFTLLGFIPASIIFLFALMALLGVTPVRAGVIAVLFTLAMYGVFGKLFLVDL